MPDPISFNPQSTNQLPGDTSPDTYRVLLRGRVRINTTDYALSGSWYTASKVVDLGQFRFSVLPMLEFYYSDGLFYKAPFVATGGSGAVAISCNATITNGAKSGSQSTKITFLVGNLSGGQVDIYYQIMSLPINGSLFP